VRFHGLSTVTVPETCRQLTGSSSRRRTRCPLRIAGSADPEYDAPIVMNPLTGLALHQLAYPDPDFDPSEQITALVTNVLRPLPAKVPA